MRICLLNNLFPPIPSGSSHFTAELARHLAQRGHEVTVITAHVSKDLPAIDTIDGVYVRRVPCVLLPQLRIAYDFRWLSFTYTPRNQHLIESIIRERDIQVLHLNGQIFDLALSAVRQKRRLRLPLVITIHSAVRHPHPFFSYILRFADRHFVRRFIIQHCDTVIVPDQYYLEYVAQMYNLPDAQLVPYGVVYPLSAKKLKQNYLENYNLDTRPLIVSVGHVQELRDRCDLISAMPLVLQEFPSAMLLVIGEVYTKKPVRLVEELGLQDHVVFAGPLPNDITLGFVQIADIEAHWSRFSIGGLGIASLEAMALGKAVMTYVRSDILGKENHLRNWKDLVITSRNDPQAIAADILQLLKDETLRETIGQNGQNFVYRNYAWDAVCMKMEAIYQQAITSHSNC